ncbi:MAG: alpha/beta hydrolase [Planctomycetes bacterium]|nr:alpha/beta hydrolase [Planctomycetota bacterium]
MHTLYGCLVETTTEDGVKLHGFLAHPKMSTSERVWIIVHGVNGNFYGSTLLQFVAETCLINGDSALLINTRGHDLASFGSSDYPARLGSMFETIDSAIEDLRGWVRFTGNEGFKRIGIVAHSLGAVKAAYALAKKIEGVDLFVALSPPRLNTDLLLADPKKCAVFQEHLAQAQSLCQDGEDHHIMRVRFPLPNWVSAATFLDKYGSGARYDYLSFIGEIPIPTLWVFGDSEVRDGSVNFRDADRQIAQAIQRCSMHHVEVIDNADHSYRAAREALGRCISNWLAVQR